MTKVREFVFLQEWFNNLQMYLWRGTFMIIKIKWFICDVIQDWFLAEGNTVSTLGWWTVASGRCASFKQIDGQIKNRRRNCLYFAMMICCCWWIFVLQGNWWTGRELKEKMFLLCDDDLLLLMNDFENSCFVYGMCNNATWILMPNYCWHIF